MNRSCLPSLPRLRRAAAGGLLATAAAASWALEIQLPPPPPIVLPGLPGRVDVSRLPLPQVVLPRPVIITPPPLPAPPQPGGAVTPRPRQQPIYMWVPPGHRKNWAKHCGKYNACGVPVLFVRDEWYDRHVHKGAKHREDDDDDRGRGHGKGEGKGEGKGRGHGKG